MRLKFSTILISLLVAFILAACGSGGLDQRSAQATAQYGADQFHAQLTAIAPATEGASK